jgi:hypothetical protein
MRHHNLQVTGSVVVNGLGLATTADLNTYTASADAKISTLQSFTASVGTTNTFTASANSRLNSIETITASNVARLNSLEIKTGSLATTGSNTFIGTQTITGSLFISADLIVQGSSSLQNITASAVSIGTNIVNLNTANPAIRYAGLVIGDSGSIGSSGSFLYDSVQDEMIFVHRGANSTVTSSVVLMGPQTYDSIGSEIYPTSNIIQKGTGNEHLVDSCIFDNGTTTCIKNNFVSTGTGLFCGQLNAITGVFGNKGGGSCAILITDNDQSNVRLRFTNSGTGGQSISIVGGNPGLSNSGLAFYDETNTSTRLYITSAGCVGINTSNPSSLLDVQNCINNPYDSTNTLVSNQWFRTSNPSTCTGASSGILFVAAGPGGGNGLATINGVTTSCGSMAITFGTRNASGAVTERLRIASNGNIGINTCTPSNLLDIEASNNTINQFRVNSCDGLNAGLRSYTTSDGPGLLINHYYAASGVPYLRTSDFVSNQGDGASTQMRFFTKDYNANPALAMIITSGRSVGIGTDAPSLHSSSSGLVVKGIGARGIIEVWDGTSGKGVFQQVGGTTYIGNLDKGSSGGSLRLLVNGSGTSATEAMVINCLGRVLINNTAAVGTGADYSRVTISGTCNKTQASGVGGAVLHLSTCENDTPFGLKVVMNGAANACLRYAAFQTGDHNITNQGNIVFQEAGGHVGIGTTAPRTKLQVTPNYNAEVPILGCAHGIATFTSTNTNYGLQLNSTSDGSFHMQSQRFDGNTTPYNLILNWAGGNVLVGTQSSLGKLTVAGTIASPTPVGGDIYTIDAMNGYQSIGNGGFVDFNGMSGFLMVNNWSNGATTLFVMGGGNTGVVGTITGTAGAMFHNPSVGGYRWCQTGWGSTANFGFQVFRTRNTA